MELPSESDVQTYLADSNWGRWGDDDQRGAINLITPEKRVAAAGLVRSGRSVSMARVFPKTPAPNNLQPAQHFMRITPTGVATDYYGIAYHGTSSTHLDALCHMWGPEGMWNGRPTDMLSTDGAAWGGVEHWSTGITTRGVLLDVERHRGTYVTLDTPVHGWELEEIARAQGVTLQPGDALIVNCGREAYEREVALWGADPVNRPGLHASCLPFIREADVSVMVWDMLDHLPTGYSLSRGVHPVLYRYGVALVDNAQLDRISAACAEEGRYEFMFTMAPLIVVGGTGSPINPLAIF
jgi:kynurenine formamidase